MLCRYFDHCITVNWETLVQFPFLSATRRTRVKRRNLVWQRSNINQSIFALPPYAQQNFMAMAILLLCWCGWLFSIKPWLFALGIVVVDPLLIASHNTPQKNLIILTLTTGMLGHVLQMNTQRIYIYIYIYISQDELVWYKTIKLFNFWNLCSYLSLFISVLLETLSVIL